MSIDKSEFLNRVRSLFNIDGHLLPELTEEQQAEFVRDPPRYFTRTDKAQSDAIWREVERRQRGESVISADPAALAEALRPFAACVEMIEQECDYADELDDVNELPEEVATSLTVGEVRAAHRVLAAWDAAQGGKG